LRPSERRICIEYMQNLGLDGFVQAQGADQSSFIPAFDLTGL
ncbi:MAG: radical SAM protein, partial [Oscillospiraceae bacterium]|nr:radical SAM protein [Oscillospiraceae bacterium]